MIQVLNFNVVSEVGFCKSLNFDFNLMINVWNFLVCCFGINVLCRALFLFMWNLGDLCKFMLLVKYGVAKVWIFIQFHEKILEFWYKC